MFYQDENENQDLVEEIKTLKKTVKQLITYVDFIQANKTNDKIYNMSFDLFVNKRCEHCHNPIQNGHTCMCISCSLCGDAYNTDYDIDYISIHKCDYCLTNYICKECNKCSSHLTSISEKKYEWICSSSCLTKVKKEYN